MVQRNVQNFIACDGQSFFDHGVAFGFVDFCFHRLGQCIYLGVAHFGQVETAIGTLSACHDQRLQ